MDAISTVGLLRVYHALVPDATVVGGDLLVGGGGMASRTLQPTRAVVPSMRSLDEETGTADRYPFHDMRYQTGITPTGSPMPTYNASIDDESNPHSDDELCPSFCRTLPELIQEAKEEIARDRVRLARLEKHKTASLVTAIGYGTLSIVSMLVLGINGALSTTLWLLSGTFAAVILLITKRQITSVRDNLSRVTFWRDICIDDAYAASKSQPRF